MEPTPLTAAPEGAQIHMIANEGHVLLERVNAYWHKLPLAAAGVIASLVMGYGILATAPVIATYPARAIGWLVGKALIAMLVFLALGAISAFLAWIGKSDKLVVRAAKAVLAGLFLASAGYFGYLNFGPSSAKALQASAPPQVGVLVHKVPEKAEINDPVPSIVDLTNLMREQAKAVSEGKAPTGCISDQSIKELWIDGSAKQMAPKCRVGEEGRLWMWGFAAVPEANGVPEHYGTFLFLSVKTPEGVLVYDVKVPANRSAIEPENIKGVNLAGVLDPVMFPRAVFADFSELTL